MKLSFLILAYKFSPYPYVGANRWKSFSENLLKLGHNVDIVSAPWQFIYKKDKSIFTKNKPRIFTTKLRPLFLIRNINIPSKFLESIRAKIFYYLIDKFYTWDDEAQFWGKDLITIALDLKKSSNNYDFIIASGHPFQVNLHSLKLKTIFPISILVQDFRDPWFQNPNYPYSKKSSRYKLANSWLEKIQKESDLFLYPTKGIKDIFTKNESNLSDHFVLKNAASKKLFNSKIKRTANNNYKYDYLYIGTLSGGRIKPFLELIKFLNKKEIVYNLLIIGRIPFYLENKLNKNPNIEILSMISQENIINFLLTTKYAIHLNGEKTPFALSTKIYEYGVFGIPVISLNYGGDISKLMEDNNLGISLDLNNILWENALDKFLKKGNLDYLPNNSFTFKERTKELISILKKYKQF